MGVDAALVVAIAEMIIGITGAIAVFFWDQGIYQEPKVAE